jgi:hypothetical protein
MAYRFLDADDLWLPHKLERQAAVLASQPATGMACGTTEYWCGWTGVPEDRARDTVPPSGLPDDTLVPPPELLLRFLRNQTRSPGTSSVLIHREVVAAVGGFEDRFPGMYEDQAFFAKVCLATSVFVTGDCVARYQQHPDSCCARTVRAGRDGATQRLPPLARAPRRPPPGADRRGVGGTRPDAVALSAPGAPPAGRASREPSEPRVPE